MFSSEENGAFVYRHTPVTSIHTEREHTSRHHIMTARGNSVDLSRYLSDSLDSPTVATVFSMSGELIRQIRNSWILTTDLLAHGMYYVHITQDGTTTLLAIFVVDS